MRTVPSPLSSVVLLFLVACSAHVKTPRPDESAAARFAPTDPCDRHEDPTRWVFESAMSALQDQQPALCACFREDAEGIQLYVSVSILPDRTVVAEVVGHRSGIEDQVACFRSRIEAGIGNWLALMPGWYREKVELERPAAAYRWDQGITCHAWAADLPVPEPALSEEWLTANPDGVLFPAEMPVEGCYARKRAPVRVNFSMVVEPPPEPECKHPWHPHLCPKKVKHPLGKK
jgi:hypothetical protein